MSKRANGEGTIFKEKSGRYRIAITVTVGGSRVRITKTAWKHADAVVMLNELRGTAESRKPIKDIRTVDQLIDRWMDQNCRPTKGDNPKSRIAPTTLDGRERAWKNHIKPLIGHKPFVKFNLEEVEKFIAAHEERNTGGSTLNWVFEVCRGAFDYAKRHHAIKENPFREVQKPEARPKDIDPFEASEVQRILEAVENSRRYALLLLDFRTGMRQGELFGLRKDRVNLQESYLIVDQQAVEVKGITHIRPPKTKAGFRRIDLPAECVEAMKRHLKIVRDEGNGDSEFFFPNTIGTVQARTNWWADQWKPLLAKLGVKHRGAHHIRHTFAVHALSKGIHVNVVSAILGHKNPSMTWDIYGKAMRTHIQNSVNKLINLYD